MGGDYAGQGGFEYSQTEDTLRKLVDWVDVTEFEVSLQSLWKFYYSKIGKAVKDPLSGVTDSEFIRFRLGEFDKLYPHILGRMLEFITKSYFEATGYPEVRIRFDENDF